MISASALTPVIEEEKQKADVNPHVGKEAFTLVTAGVHTTIKESSLYRLVEDLLCENPARAETKEDSESVGLLSAYRVEHHIDVDGHECWFIHFDTASENHLFLGFELKGRHLRIDARFADDNTLKAKRGLSKCHSTEEYVHPVTGERKVVHVFIGQNGYISHQIKTYTRDGTLEKDGSRKDSEDAFLKEIIKNNAEPAVALAKKLMDEKHDRYMKAKKKSYEIDAELNVTMEKILINSTQSSNRLTLKAEYGVLVHSFSVEVAMLNRYNDQEIDERAVRLKQRYALMNRPEIVLEVVESKEVSESQVEPVDSLENTQTAVVKESLSMKAKTIEMQLKQDSERTTVLIAEIKESMDKLNSFFKKKNPLEISELISRQDLKQEVNKKLIELVCFSSITKENNVYIEEVAKTLKKIPALLESFKHSVKLGELEWVIQLYSHVQYENLQPIFYDLIFTRLVPSRGEELEQIIAIAKFFYENATGYHAALQMLENLYIASPNHSVSLLFYAFVKGNYLAFKLMLDQGFNPNGVGIVCEKVTASVINGIACFMRPKASELRDTRYIKALLSFGALVDKKTPNLASNIEEAVDSVVKQKKAKKMLKKSKLHIVPHMQDNDEGDLSNRAVLKKVLSLHSALEILCDSDELSNELLALFASESSLSSLLSAFVSLINDKDVRTRFVIGTAESTFAICDDERSVNLITARMCDDSACQKYISYIIYHTDILYPIKPQKVTLWVENVLILAQALEKQCREISEQNPQYIAVLYEKLLEKAKKSEDLVDKTNFYTSALYLQLLNADGSFQSAQKIVQVFCHLGQAYFYHRLFDPVSRQRTINAFGNAYLCCVRLECSKELQAIPLFEFAKRKLVELDVNLEQLTNPQLQTIVPPALTETAVGSPITPAAAIQAREAPSLTMLANANADIPSEPPVASMQKNVKKKKKKK